MHQREVMAAWEFVKANLHPYPTAAFSAAVERGGQRTIVRPDVLIRDVDGELDGRGGRVAPLQPCA